MEKTNESAPEEEIEITPEMIKAGVNELKLSFSYDGHMDDYEDIVAEIFRKMTLAAMGDHRSPGAL